MGTAKSRRMIGKIRGALLAEWAFMVVAFYYFQLSTPCREEPRSNNERLYPKTRSGAMLDG
jgi:hypothetical protein